MAQPAAQHHQHQPGGPHVGFAVANAKLWAMGVKLFSQVIVILSNYIFSKVLIFKKK